MARLYSGYRQSQCLRVAAQIRLPELLAQGPMSASEIAAATATHEGSLRRLLRALAAMEVVTEEGSSRFALTPFGEQLRADRLGPAAELFNSMLYWQAWQNLDHSVRTGERAFDYAFGMRNWDYYATHPDDARRFDAAMSANTVPVTTAVANAYSFSAYQHLVDIGGGDGTLIREVLSRYPHIRATLFDRPDVVEQAKNRIRDAALVDRVDFVGGSFFESVPAGADAYILKSIIHDWTDEDATRILKRCRGAAATGTHVLLIERILPERPNPEALEAFMMDLNMLVNTGGRERTEAEYRDLLSAADLHLQRVVQTDAPLVAVLVSEAV
jgi:hypothetical protein